MSGRLFIPLAEMNEARLRGAGIMEGSAMARRCPEWLTIGVLAAAAPPKQSSKGSDFLKWTLTDLKSSSPSSVTLLVFSPAVDAVRDAKPGSLFVVFAPTVMPPRREGESYSKLSLSVSSAGNLVHIGTTEDLGTCAGTKKDGGKCSMIVNKRVCPFCQFHVGGELKRSKAHDAGKAGGDSGGTGTRLFQRASTAGPILGTSSTSRPMLPASFSGSLARPCVLRLRAPISVLPVTVWLCGCAHVPS